MSALTWALKSNRRGERIGSQSYFQIPDLGKARGQ